MSVQVPLDLVALARRLQEMRNAPGILRSVADAQYQNTFTVFCHQILTGVSSNAAGHHSDIDVMRLDLQTNEK